MSATTMTGTPRGRSGRDRTMTVMTWIAPPILLGILIVAWEVYVATYDVEQILLPAPHVIFDRFVDDLSLLTRFARSTLVEAMKGLFLAVAVSVVLAGAVHRVRWLANGLESWSGLLKALPVVALYPICTVFFGIGSTAVVAIVAIGATPIMFLYVLRGFSGSSEHDELMRSISAGPWIRFTNLTLPRSLPYLMAGLRTAAPTSVIIAIIAEYFGGRVTTLGSYIRRESANLHTVQTWSAVLAACLLGLFVFGVVAVADRFLLRWHPSRR